MKLASFALVIGLSALAASGQNPAATPDLSGTWEYATDSPFKDRVLVITQTADELNLVENYIFENARYTHRSTLFTDGRGEVNRKQFPDGEPPSDGKSKTVWKKGKLFVRLTYAHMMQSRGIRYTVTVDEEQTWSLSKDGETLTINIRSKRDAPAIASVAIPTTGRSIYRRKR